MSVMNVNDWRRSVARSGVDPLSMLGVEGQDKMPQASSGGGISPPEHPSRAD